MRWFVVADLIASVWIVNMYFMASSPVIGPQATGAGSKLVHCGPGTTAAPEAGWLGLQSRPRGMVSPTLSAAVAGGVTDPFPLVVHGCRMRKRLWWRQFEVQRTRSNNTSVTQAGPETDIGTIGRIRRWRRKIFQISVVMLIQ
jgi:hypothetical protein